MLRRVLLGMTLLPLFACSPQSSSSSVVGKWSFLEDKQEGIGLEFFSDKTWNLPGKMEGTYSILDDGRIKMNVTMLGGSATMFIAHMDGVVLVLDGADGKPGEGLKFKKKS